MDSNEKSKKTKTEHKIARGRLTTDRTFVLQFREPTNDSKNLMDGRIEHVSSGRAMLFQNKDDLCAFLEEVLDEKKQ